MVLVPEGKAFRLDSHPTVQTPSDPLGRLDSELSAIHYEKKFNSDAEKWLAYQQILEKYLQKKGVFGSVTASQPPPRDDDAKTEEESKKALDASVMAQSVAKTYRSKAKQLADFIASSSNIGWTDTGRVVIDNVELPNSNMIDLLNDAVRERKSHAPPNGRAQLSNALRKAGVPQKLIGNPAFWNEGETSPNNSRENFAAETSTPQESPKQSISKWLSWQS